MLITKVDLMTVVYLPAVSYNQSQMQGHCLLNSKMEPFPVRRQRRIPSTISYHQTIQVFCLSNAPYSQRESVAKRNAVFARNGSMKFVSMSRSPRKRGNQEPSGFVQSTNYNTESSVVFCIVCLYNKLLS